MHEDEDILIGVAVGGAVLLAVLAYAVYRARGQGPCRKKAAKSEPATVVTEMGGKNPDLGQGMV